MQPKYAASIVSLLLATVGLVGVLGGDTIIPPVKEITFDNFGPNQTYYLEVRTDGQSRVSQVSPYSPPRSVDVNKLFTGIDQPDIPDLPDPPPSDGSLEDRTRKIALQINDPDTARDLAVAYSVILLTADRYSDVNEIGIAARDAAEAVLQQRNVENKWNPLRTFVSQEFTKAAQEGRLRTVSEYSGLLAEVRDGLMGQSARTAEAFDLRTVLDLVQMVLDVIQTGDKLTIPQILEIVMKVLQLFGRAGMEGMSP